MLNKSASLITEPLAVVGMDCLLPGANGLDAFWNLLVNGGDAIGRMPEERLDRHNFFDAQKGIRGKSYSDVGGIVPPREIDFEKLNLSESDVSNWDECHLLLADVARAACQDARLSEQFIADQKIGVYVGHSGGSRRPGELTYAAHAEMLASLLMDCGSIPEQSQRFRDVITQRLVETFEGDRPRRLPGGKPYLQASSAARLIAESLSIEGPQMTIDAACASSLVALAMAATALQQGEIDAAIVGGASYNKSDSMILFSNAHSCSATGTRPFDDQADGLVSSEGYVALVVKTLARAEQDGDQIWGVLRGMGMASDGKGKSLWAPRHEGQLAAIQRAYSEHLDPARIQYVEAHATSTKVGDATEARSLTEFFQSIPSQQPRRLGSVKSNIGHTLETAGLAGLVKTMLSMQKQQIPQIANLRTRSSEIDWQKLPFEIPVNQPAVWDSNGQHPRCAAVNAFGIGGLNVHLVVEQFEFDYHSQLLEQNRRQSLSNAGGSMSVSTYSREPIAIVGRGVIVPGANDLMQLAQLIANPSAQIGLPTEKRWPTQSFAMKKLAACSVESLTAGYLNNYEYDWQKNKVPPKQIAQANPLQFMFLDAAQQAIDEFQKNASGQLDRTRTTAVVGTIFGGEFGHQLHLGLRFRQIVDEFRETLKPTGINDAALDECVAEFETKFFDLNPALLDETGSFTSSTLASRITKQFNLMGGALAVDSGECSGLVGIDASLQLLRQRACDALIYATGQRMMDLVSFEELAQRGELTPDHVPAEGVVSLLLMRQSDAVNAGHKIYGILDSVESDFTPNAPARAAAKAIDRISAVQGEDVTLEPSPRSQIKSKTTKTIGALTKILPNSNSRSATLQPQIGSLGAAHAALSIVAGTMRDSSLKTEDHAPTENSILGKLLQKTGYAASTNSPTGHQSDSIVIQSEDHSGLAYALLFHRSPVKTLAEQSGGLLSGHPQQLPGHTQQNPRTYPVAQPDTATSTELSPTHTAAEALTKTSSTSAPDSSASQSRSTVTAVQKMVGSIRQHDLIPTAVSAGTISELVSKIASAEFGNVDASNSAYQCVIVSGDEREFSKQRSLAANATSNNGLHRLSQFSIFVRSPELTTKRPFALLFPGQGSQDANVFKQWSSASDASRRVVAQIDGWLSAKDQPSIQQLAMQTNIPFDNGHGGSVSSWPVQITMIAANAMLMANLKSSWLANAVCAGHSLGEFSALQHADAIEIPDLLNLIAARATAVDSTIGRTPSGLLSLRADSRTTQSVLSELNQQLFITHSNSPIQTIVGGQLNDIRMLESECQRRQIDARPLAVPAAFHTPLMSSAAEQFRSALSVTHFAPTNKAILSGVGNKFICDPIELRRALFEQMTSPLNFVGLVGRLYESNCRVFLECGPGNVLSSLTQSILGDAPALCWSIGRKNQTASRALAELAALEFLFTPTQTIDGTPRTSMPESSEPQFVAPSENPVSPSSDFPSSDFPSAARSQTTENPSIPSIQPSPSKTVSGEGVFDATQRRRDRRRSQANRTSSQVAPGSTPNSISQNSPGSNSWPETNGPTGMQIGSAGDQNSISHSATDWLATSVPTGAVPTGAVPNNAASANPEATNIASNPGAALASETAQTYTPDLSIEPTSNSVGRAEIENFINDFIIEQTGYGIDMLDPDWDLEADLGIDSIKQAQLFGELRDTFGIEYDTDEMTSESVRTIRQITDKTLQFAGQIDLQKSSDSMSIESNLSSPPTNTPSIGASDSADNGSGISAEHHVSNPENDISPSIDPHELRRFMLDFIIDHTGYPEEMISDDADFEADLALDSIKLAQLFGELRSQYPESFDTNDHSALSSVRSLADMVELFGSSNATTIDQNDSPRGASAEALPASTDSIDTEFGAPAVTKSSASSVPPPKLHSLRVAIESAADRLHYQNELASNEIASNDIGLTKNEQLTPDNYALAQPTGETPIHPISQHEIQAAAAAVRVSPESLSALSNQDNQLHQAISGFADVPASSEPSRVQPDRFLDATNDEPQSENELTRRFVLRMEPTDLIAPANEDVKLIGACLVVGNNDVAENIENRLSDSGHRVLRVDVTQPIDKIKRQIDELWLDEPALNLFVASALDPVATVGPNRPFDPDRTQVGTRGLFWICQHWYSKVVEADRIGDIAIVGFGSLGGDLGFTKPSASIESGMVAGLVKALHIETWVAGYRGVPIKHIDCNSNMSGKQIADAAWYELTNHTHEIETGWIDGRRHAVRAIGRPLAREVTDKPNEVLPAGNWICTGGARGITARAAIAIGASYGVVLHLVGKTELVDIEDHWLTRDPEKIREIKRSVMQSARDSGENPMQRWKSIEKTIEIRNTLSELNSQGIAAHYYASDLSDPPSVQRIVKEIVSEHGPITGCLHGAGSGEDARFEKKNRSIVEPCLGTKIAGTLALIQALSDQPLRHFIGFGSISGRFGANGQTDYSSANETLAKITGWLRQYRPEVRATAFLWHAWGDVGMATKAENKLALEIIGMQFMPANEGVSHMLREIEAGLPEREILITDDHYRELFFPSEEIASLVTHESDSKSSTDLRRELRFEVNLSRLAILDDGVTIEKTADRSVREVMLDPQRDIFLREHVLDGNPLLPIVIGAEMMVESAVDQLGLPSWFQHRTGILLENLVATRGLRFFDSKPVTVRLRSEQTSTGCNVVLNADFYSRAGQLMQADRKHMSASVRTLDFKRILDWQMPRVSWTNWRKARYPAQDQVFHVGPAFQVLKSIAVDDKRALGQLRVPALVELAGTHRHCEGWQTPSAILDGCLFATGVLNWEKIREGVSLPVGIEQLAIHRMPALGTQLTLDTRFVRQDETHGWFDFCLWDNLGNLILEAKNYQTAWLK